VTSIGTDETHRASPRGWRPGHPVRAALLGLLTVGLAVFLGGVLSAGPDGVILAPGIAADPKPFLGRTEWAVPVQIVCFAAYLAFLVYVVRANRRTPDLHSALVVFLGLSVLALQDPIQNWAVYAAYDPQLLHFPTTWPYFNTSPTVEPLLPLLLYPIAFGVPALVAMALYRRVVRPRLPRAGFLARHPVLCTFLVGEAVALPTTFVFEFVATRMHIFTFTQLWPAVTIFGGSQGQMHIFYEGPALGALIAISTTFLWQDDRGRTVLYRMAERRGGRSRRATVVGLAMLILTVYYGAYGVPYWLMRLTNSATSVARPWPLANTKVYDPQYRQRQAGVPGPHYQGPLAGWPSGQ
jgi:hypothetical protein